ncbi:MAG: hypothetical protein Q8933_16545 [Bacteroidota bacterium]|nr:hypothetical protein [Bacteroidota bacterium]MDP4191873.1 hypothetical protein [Bacteroidota bacterium]MDP4196676.1 hypothetical protein [Bacteroidota bacterium]
MHRRSLFLVFILICLFSSILFSQSIAYKTAFKIESNPKEGFYWPYIVFLPDSEMVKGKSISLLVAPNNTGTVSDDFKLHEEYANKILKLIEPFSDKLNAALLVPIFPRPESRSRVYTHALDRDVMLIDNDSLRRPDVQLTAMIADLRKRLSNQGITLQEKILMFGFSASGMFVNRFTFLHPELVKASAIGSPGGWPIVPVTKYKHKSLRYPIGIADFKKIAGKSINLSEIKKVKMYFFLGDKDNNDSVPYSDSYDDQDRQLIMKYFGPSLQKRWLVCDSLYHSIKLNNAKFVMYPNAEHKITTEMKSDLLKFFSKAIKE